MLWKVRAGLGTEIVRKMYGNQNRLCAGTDLSYNDGVVLCTKLILVSNP